MLETIARVFAELHFQYTEQFMVALPPMALTVFIHGVGMGLAGRLFTWFAPRGSVHLRAPHRVLLVMGIVAIMLAAHFVEVNVWAMYYVLTGMLTDYREAMFFSVNAYTTLGASNITLPGRWKGLDGLEAMTAMLMFGWSTAILAVVVARLHNLDAPGKD